MKPVGNAGRRIPWDYDRALELWNQGVRLQEIADELGVNKHAIQGACSRWKWPKRKKPRAIFLRQSVSRVTPIGKVTKRCARCLARYEANAGDTSPHCAATLTHSIYVESAYELFRVAA